MRFPIRLIQQRWPKYVTRHFTRFMRVDPRVLLEDEPDPEKFRSAMSNLHVGETIKITGTKRHPLSDAILTQHVDLAKATIVDIGASDGSTSVDLVEHIRIFKAYIIADLYLEVTAVQVGKVIVFRDHDGTDILVASKRTLAWPTLSRIVKAIYYPYTALARSRRGRSILLLNPDARRLVATDPRITTRVHDIFMPWGGPQPDVIKVANVLRRLYFTDGQIKQALHVVYSTLPAGGHLLVVDNPRITDITERGALYRRDESAFTMVASTEQMPEIADLILAVRDPAQSLSRIEPAT